ncbi:putative FAD binding domain protein [Rosellinia necatrix]|uniref:Putative FAD binding domain protein n=1 Tax=Rosellinia necatrix TaxID=77044 RepID=A0A1W2TQK3_ROSNE|nr:putative FAD binding domain protein [Rosellinia necatrix]
MHQLGKSISPGTFDRDEYSKVQCSYKCIFGMSRLTPGIKPSTNHLVLGNGHSYLILAGSEKVYWFLNAKNTRVMYGKEIPRYTAEDERRLAEEHFGDRLNEQDTFKDVYENKIMATLTPLHEYQWKRWYFQRIMTIGDASHKLNPISGNGGSAAVEDAAALFSVLQRKLGQSQVRLSTRDFQDIFAETQHVQETRTRHLISHATKMQEFDAMQSLFSPLLAKFVIPHLTDDAMLALVGDNTTQARCIESFQVPRRPRYVPYEDELPADILKDVWIVRVFVVLWYLVYFLYSVTPQYFIHPTYIMKCIHAASQWHSSIPTIASGKTNPLAFEISLFPMIFIWNVEGYRRGNRRTIGSRHVAIFFSAVLAASRKAGVVPLYFILAACNSSRTRYTSPAGRPLPVSAARAVLTGTFMVYGVSLFFIGLQLYTTIPAAYIASVFQWQPLVIAVIIWGLANANKVSDHHAELEPDRTHMGAYLDKDYPYLTQLYLVLFAFGATANIYVPALADDERLVTIMVCSHCLHSVFEMRRLGYIPTRDARNVMLAILFALQFIGPGALFAATWAWRERLIYRLSRGYWAVGE